MATNPRRSCYVSFCLTGGGGGGRRGDAEGPARGGGCVARGAGVAEREQRCVRAVVCSGGVGGSVASPPLDAPQSNRSHGNTRARVWLPACALLGTSPTSPAVREEMGLCELITTAQMIPSFVSAKLCRVAVAIGKADYPHSFSEFFTYLIALSRVRSPFARPSWFSSHE